MFSQPIHGFESSSHGEWDRCRQELASITINKTRAVAKKQIDLAERRVPSYRYTHTCSVFKFVFWLSLSLSVRGQSTEPFPPTIELSTLKGTTGFALNGEASGDRSGRSVSGAGDVNDDGVEDLIIGAYTADPSGKRDAGKSYVIFGRSGLGRSGSLELSSLNGTTGFAINGEVVGNQSGRSVSGAGDVNGDGVEDLIIGAHWADPSGKGQAGKSYVVFGKKGLGSSGSLELSSLNGTSGFVLNGDRVDDRSGRRVSGAGDVNGDGVEDLIIGAIGADPNGKGSAGKSYVVFGKRDLGSSGSLELSSLNGTTGFVLNGEAVGDLSGQSVSGVGDVDGDGVDDLIIGAVNADPNGQDKAGKSYVVFGQRGLGSSGSLELSSLNGTTGFVLNGEVADDASGISVSGVGDVNGDGVDDLIIGAFNATFSGKDQAGKSYVVFGRSGLGSSGSLELSSLNGTTGFAINGEAVGDLSGVSVSGAGDVNGDGVEDLIIGASNATPSGKYKAGKSYVVFGRSGLGSSGNLELSTLNGTTGFVLNGEAANDISGFSVSGAGDVNGDGVEDLIIGAFVADPSGKPDAGKSYVVFGRRLSPLTMPSSILNTPTDQGTDLSQSASKDSLSINTSAPNPIGVSSHSSVNPLIAGLISAVAALACSIFGGVVFHFKKRGQTQPTPAQPNPEDTPGYVAISSLQPEMVSAKLENAYAILPSSKNEGHYNQWPSKPVTHNQDQYDEVNLDMLNQDMSNYQEAKLHQNYSDINEL